MVTQTFSHKTLIWAHIHTVSLLSAYIDLPLSGPFVQAFHSLDIPLILHFPLFVAQLMEQLSNFPNTVYCANLQKTAFSYCVFIPSLLFKVLSSSIVSFIHFISFSLIHSVL